MLIIMLRIAQNIYRTLEFNVLYFFNFFFRIQRCFSYDSNKLQIGSTDLTALDEYSV